MRVCCFLFFAILMTVDAGISGDVGNKQVMGWRERARLLPEDLVVDAKLDTGADTSSLNVPHLTRMEKDGDLWVRFSVTDSDGKQSTFERKVVRVAKIKRHFGERQERPVVIVRLCVGRYCADAEVNLVDRSRFTCPLLVGRRFMAHAVVVDPALEHSAEPGNDGKEAP